MNNLEKIQQKLTTDCAVITSDVNRRYFTGMKSSAGTVLIFKDAAYLIIDSRYFEKASDTVKNCTVILQDRLFEQMTLLCKKHGVKAMSIESRDMTVSRLRSFRSKMQGITVIDDDSLSDTIEQLRSVKSDDEIYKIKKAQRIAEKAFDEALHFIKKGITQRELALFLNNKMFGFGAEDLSFETIALSGADTSLPHGVPSDKPIGENEFVLMDFGAVYEGYHSDMTRTVCVGEPDEDMSEVYSVVLKAQERAINSAFAGTSGSRLDTIARDVIEEAGYGKFFGHGLGHGVGMEIHEAPTASPASDKILQCGEVVTIEPGIYLPKRFGVRIEDFVVIEQEFCSNLTKSPKNLICL